MILAIGVAVLDCIWLVALHPNAAGLIVAHDVAVVVVAAAGFLALGSVARRRPEGVVVVTLVAVDAVTIGLGLGQPGLGLVAVGYLLLLPVIVSLVIPWATRIAVTWLGLHAVLAFGYGLYAPSASIPDGARDQLVGLLVVAIAVSQFGHLTGVRSRVSSFTQIEQITALNRRARRDQMRLDSLNAALETAAATDVLTGVGNRLALDAGLRLARSRIERQGESYGLLILDLDRFKAINDERGHLAGDDVLRAASKALRGVVRPGDSAFRYGGEEFVTLISLTRPSDALAAAERIRAAIESLQIPNAGNAPYGHLTASVGVTTVGPLDLSADDASWLARADAALYRAKANGRNRCEIGPGNGAMDGADRSRSAAVRSKGERRAAASRSRPTIGAAERRDLAGDADATASTRHAGTGAAFHLASSAGTASAVTASRTSRHVGSPMTTDPGSAPDWSRDAVFMASPMWGRPRPGRGPRTS